jgi:hypothetical protein
MIKAIRLFADCAEVWIFLIPLFFILRCKKELPGYLKPVRLYVFVGLFLNILIIISWKLKNRWNLPDFLHSNNFLYNIHSIVRLLLFSLFFIKLNQPFLPRLKKLLPIGFLIFVIINFSFFENFYKINMFSSVMLSIEAGIILFYCLQYLLFLAQEEKDIVFHKQPGFWIVVGLSIYEAVSFPIFLLYTTLVIEAEKFSIGIWDVHNTFLLILCILIAKTFRGYTKQ